MNRKKNILIYFTSNPSFLNPELIKITIIAELLPYAEYQLIHH